MIENWTDWIKSFKLPDDIHIYNMNGKIVFTLSGYNVVETNYVYLSDLKDIYVRGIRLDNLNSEDEVHKALANVALRIQIDVKNPKSYANYRFNDKTHIVAP